MRPISYLLPSSPSETQRMESQHRLFLRVLGHHTLVRPLELFAPGVHILDIGCGVAHLTDTSREQEHQKAAPSWVRDVFGLRRDLHLVGIDVQVDMGALHALPHEVDRNAAENTASNVNTQQRHTIGTQDHAGSPGGTVQLVHGDVLAGLPFPDGSFDFVHQRQLCAAIPADCWQRLIDEAVRVTKPGGWVELVEAGPVQSTVHQSAHVRELEALVRAYSQTRGIDLTMTTHLGDILQRSPDIAPVTLRTFDVSLLLGRSRQPWGEAAAANWIAARQAMGPAIINGGLVGDQRAYHDLLLGAAEELRSHQAPWPIHVAYAQRQY